MKKLKCILIAIMILTAFGCSKDPIQYFEKGKSDFKAGRFYAAIENFRHAKYFLPDNFEVNLYLGKTFSKYNEDKDAKYKARYYYKKASEFARTSEEYFHVKLALLSLYSEKNRYSEIIKTCTELRDNYKSLIKNKMDFEIQNVLAEAYFQTGSYDKSVTIYESILRKHENIIENNPELRSMTYLKLGAAEIILGPDKNIKRGVENIREAENCDYSPFSRTNKISAATCYSITGKQFYKMENYEEAIKYYQKSKDLFVSVNDRGQIKEISSKLDKTYKKHDENCDTYPCIMRRGLREMDDEDFDDAAEEFKKAVDKGKTREDKTEALLKMGIALFWHDEFEDALAGFKKLDRKYQKDVSDLARFNLYYGAALILAADKPSKANKLFDNVKNYLNSESNVYIKKERTFKEQILKGQKKIDLSFKVSARKIDDNLRYEIADIYSKVGNQFEKWKMLPEAKNFYQSSKESFQYLANKKRADKVQQKLDSLNS